MKFKQGDFVIISPKVFSTRRGPKLTSKQRTGVITDYHNAQSVKKFDKVTVLLNTGETVKHILIGKVRLSKTQDQPF